MLKQARKNGLKDDKLVDLMLTQLAGIAEATYQKEPNTWLSEVSQVLQCRIPETEDLLSEDKVYDSKWAMDRVAKRLTNKLKDSSKRFRQQEESIATRQNEHKSYPKLFQCSAKRI